MKAIAGMMGAAAIALAAHTAAAGPLQDGFAAYQRQDYVRAARLLQPFADTGNARAQTYVGFMYQYGRGLPQNYVEAAIWYCLAADQGYAYAQYLLGLLYDKGHGVDRDYIEAYKWVSLAVAGAPRNEREAWTRVRDAIASKMSVEQIALGQQLAVQWRPRIPVRKQVVIEVAPAGEPVLERK